MRWMEVETSQWDYNIEKIMNNPDKNSLLDLHTLMNLPDILDIKKPKPQRVNCQEEGIYTKQHLHPPTSTEDWNEPGEVPDEHDPGSEARNTLLVRKTTLPYKTMRLTLT